MDLGAAMQNICLAAVEQGLGTCIEDQSVVFPDVVRKALSIPDDKRIVIAIAIGYPDKSFPVNKLESGREPLESNCAWLGFE